MAYDRSGHGPALVLLHPLGADRRVWDPILDHLTELREIMAIDLPGFGESAPLAQKPTPRALAVAVAAFLEAIGIDRPHVAGNSLGGWVALELALAGNARSATAIAPAGMWPEPLMPKRERARRLARAALPLVGIVAATTPGRRLLLGGTVARPDRVPAKSAAHLVRAYATAPGFTQVNDAMRATRFEGIERIRTPVTLAWAEHDHLVRPPSRLPPQVKTRMLEGCGHIPMWDEPAEVARVVIEGSSAGA